MPRFKNPSVAGPEFRDKRQRGRPKHEHGRSKREHGRYVSKAASHFGNLCVYEPSTLWKKPSDSSEKLSDSQKKPSDFHFTHVCVCVCLVLACLIGPSSYRKSPPVVWSILSSFARIGLANSLVALWGLHFFISLHSWSLAESRNY